MYTSRIVLRSFNTATQKVVELPMETSQDVTITSSARRQALKTEVTPTFTKPMAPEIRVRERAIAK